jgi:hypothetical protein
MGNREFDENRRRALLASALRALEERVALARKLYKQVIDSGHRFCRNAGPKGRANSSGRWMYSAVCCGAWSGLAAEFERASKAAAE